MKKIFLFAGESSGDLHGGKLIKALKEENSSLELMGVGGPTMRSEGLKGSLQMEDFQVMGFTDVLKSLPKLYRQFQWVKKTILDQNPEVVILIDYPGFTLRLAKALRKSGYKGKLVHYIAPTVWAHGKGRIKALSDHYDLLLTIFPFESVYFENTRLKVHYVGNPLVETLQNHRYQDDWAEAVGLNPLKPILAIFPGSRKGEIERNLPIQLEAALELQGQEPGLQIGLSVSDNCYLPLINQLLEKSSLKKVVKVPSSYHYELMRDSTTALAKSGTVTLELALHEKPTVVTYALTPLNYFVAKYVMRLNLPYYCIVNILSNQATFPEFMGLDIPAPTLKTELLSLHFDQERRKGIVENCRKIKQQLTLPETHRSAAKTILSL